MTFARDLEAWAAAQLTRVRDGSEYARNLRRLLRGADTQSLSPVDRMGIESESVTARPGSPEILPTSPDIGVGFVYHPISDDAVYGWGIPFEDPPGTPVNPPLGTTLSNISIGDATYQQYRRAEIHDGTWICVHQQSLLGGKKWKRSQGRIVSWEIFYGGNQLIPIDERSAPVFYGGDVLTNYPDGSLSNWVTLAANLLGSGDQRTLYVLVYQGANYRIVRRNVDLAAIPPAPTSAWEESADFVLPDPYDNAAINTRYYGSSDINASCNEATIIALHTSGSGSTRRAYYGEIKITWDAGLNTNVILLDDSANNWVESGPKFGSGDGGSTPYGGDNDEVDSHCFIGLYDPLISSSWGLKTGDWSGTLTAIIGAAYQEDGDNLRKFEIEIKETGTNNNGSSSTTYSYVVTNLAGYKANGYTSDEVTNDVKETRVKLSFDGRQILERRVYLETNYWTESYATSWNGTAEQAWLCGQPGSGQTTTGSGNGSSEDYRSHIGIPPSLRNPITGGVAWGYNRFYEQSSTSWVAGASCVSDVTRCHKSYSDTGSTDNIKDWCEWGNQIIGSDGSVIDSFQREDENSHCHWSGELWNDGPDADYYAAIMLDQFAGSGALIRDPDIKIWEVLHMPDGQLVAQTSQYLDNIAVPITVWTGGDLMALTEAQGNNQRVKTDVQKDGFALIG